jgi:hypothetical protein
MKQLTTGWLALAALTLAACSAQEPPQATTAPTPSAKSSAAMPAMPILPAGGAAQADTLAATPLLPTVIAATGQDERAAAAPKSERELLVEAIADEHNAAMEAFYGLYRAAKTDAERQALAETTSPPDVTPFRLRMRALLEQNAADAAGFEGLKWLLNNVALGEDPALDVKLLETHHFASERMADVLKSLQYANNPAASALLVRLGNESPHKNVRGRALMVQAEVATEQAGLIAAVQAAGDEPDRAQFVQYFGEEEVARLAQLDAIESEARAVQLYEVVLRDYADVPSGRKGLIGETAAASLHELRNLVVGKPAPEITGEDIQGVAFKLSDYRGKVVMLDFWGHW